MFKRLLLLLFVPYFSYSTEAVNKSQYITHNLVVELITDSFGSKSPCSEVEQRIRFILKKHKYSFADRLEIRCFNRWIIRKNAAIASIFFFWNFMYIDEKWVSKMDDEQLEFLILHEATHHSEWHNLLQVVNLVGSYQLLIYLVNRIALMGPNISSINTASNMTPEIATKLILTAGGISATVLAWFLEQKAFSRYLEGRADAKAAYYSGNPEAGIKLFEQMKEWEKDYEANCSTHPILKLKRRFFKWFFSPLRSHPSLEERIKRLEAIKAIV